MKPSSAKAKGAALQKWVRDKMYLHAPELQEGDARSTSMGASGEDVQLSPKAREVFLGTQWECKNLAKIAAYGFYQQAAMHGKSEPVVVMKQNHCKPLALVDAEWLIRLMAEHWRLKNK